MPVVSGLEKRKVGEPFCPEGLLARSCRHANGRSRREEHLHLLDGDHSAGQLYG
mgnify:CR=1 FL=1|jgi:hypothetical protein